MLFGPYIFLGQPYANQSVPQPNSIAAMAVC
jgi:hypothetical protein